MAGASKFLHITIVVVLMQAILAHAQSNPFPGMIVEGDDRARASRAAFSAPPQDDEDYSYMVVNPAPVAAPVPVSATKPSVPLQQRTPMKFVRDQEHRNLVVWEMCGKDSTIRAAKGHGSENKDAACSQRAPYERTNPLLIQYMEAYMLTCAQESAARVGYIRPEKLFLNIDSSYVFRRIRGSDRLSLHARGLAIDIYSMSLIGANGERQWTSNQLEDFSGTNKKFYLAFRACWARKVSCDDIGGSIGLAGSGGTNNHDHDDHLHLQVDPRRCGALK